MKELTSIKVSSNAQIAPNAWLLKFPRKFEFVAGQVIGITLQATEEPRLYSIASGIHDNEVWILYTKKPDGLLTPPLSLVSKGDTIMITRPFGNFTGKNEKAVWIATGTGIAPFASMFFSGYHQNITLIQGNRNKSGLYFSDLFAQKLGERYQPCCSREPHEGCFSGRVTDYLNTRETVDPEIPYYLCGIAEMVVDTRDLLISRGVPFGRIMAEIFF